MPLLSHHRNCHLWYELLLEEPFEIHPFHFVVMIGPVAGGIVSTSRSFITFSNQRKVFTERKRQKVSIFWLSAEAFGHRGALADVVFNFVKELRNNLRSCEPSYCVGWLHFVDGALHTRSGVTACRGS